MALNPVFPLSDPAVLNDPFPFFRQCRKDSPILFHADWNAWFIFAHEDITALTRNPRLSARRMDLFIQAAPANVQAKLEFLESELKSMVVMLDAEDHLRVRKNLQHGFTPRMIQTIGPAITRHVESLIEKIIPNEACDAATQICRELPLLVLADLFALPAADFPRLRQWACDFVEYFNREPVPEPYALALVRSGREMITYTRELIAQRRANPGEDLVSALVRGQSEEAGLSDDEIVANVMMVLIAGNDTVGSALGNAVYLLLNHPEQLNKIMTGETSWEDAFEECLRFEPANPVIMRKVAENFEYKGHAFEERQFVFLALASGSRDEEYFADSESFHVDNREIRHLTFGAGAHFCIGAALARAEALALLPRLFAKLPGFRLDPAQKPEWLRTLGVRGPRTLPVVYF